MLDRDHYSYIVPGYSGHIPGNLLEREEYLEKPAPKAHIPGYKGYVASIKSENLIGKTYGKITGMVAAKEFHKGADVKPIERYTSLNREAYVNLRTVNDRKIAEVVGVKPPPPVYERPIPKTVINTFHGVGEEGEG